MGKKSWHRKGEFTRRFWPHGEIAAMLGLYIDKLGFSETANVILDEQRKAFFAKVYPIKELPDILEVLDF